MKRGRPTRRRPSPGPILLATLLFLAPALQAQDQQLPRVAVEVRALGERNPTVESVASTIFSTLRLSLALSGEVVLTEEDETPDLLFSVDLSQEDGRYLMRASRGAFDGAEPEEIALREAESLFDIFDVADALTLDIVSEITDAEVAFASLRLENRGFRRPWELLIDGVSLGANVSRVDRILTGERNVSVVSPEGEPYYTTAVELAAGETRSLVFALPWAETALRAELSEALGSSRARLLGRGEREASVDALLSRLPGEQARLRLSTLLEEPPSAGGKRLPAANRERFTTALGLPAEQFSSPFPPALAEAGRSVISSGGAVRSDELVSWFYATNAPPLRVDPPREEDPNFFEASERSGTDLHEVVMQRSPAGLHFYLRFHDGDAMRSNASYRVSLVADHPDSEGRIELFFNLEGSGSLSATTEVREISAGEDRTVATFRSPFDFTDEVLLGTIPEEAIARAREPAAIGGWNLEANVYEMINGTLVPRDQIGWSSLVYF